MSCAGNRTIAFVKGALDYSSISQLPLSGLPRREIDHFIACISGFFCYSAYFPQSDIQYSTVQYTSSLRVVALQLSMLIMTIRFCLTRQYGCILNRIHAWYGPNRSLSHIPYLQDPRKDPGKYRAGVCYCQKRATILRCSPSPCCGSSAEY